MNEIVCVHLPRVIEGVNIKVDPKTGQMSDEPFKVFICGRCHGRWNDGEKEPEIVIARIR